MMTHVAHPLEQARQDLAAEQRGQPIAFGRVPDAADDGLAFDGLRQKDREAAQDEERRQRHDKARQPGLDDDQAVQRADGDTHRESHQDREPHRPAQNDAENRDHHSGKTDHRSDRKVEFAGDHQQAGTHRDDHELRRHDRPVHHALRVEHAGIEGKQKEKGEHNDRAADAAKFGADQGLVKPGSRLYAFIDRVNC